MAGRCDGLVVLGRTVSDDVVEELAARGTPLVLVARPPIGDASTRSTPRTATSAVELADHLLAAGRPPAHLRRRPRRLARRRRALAGRLGRPSTAAEHDVAIELVTVYDLDEDAGAAVADGGPRRAATCPTPSSAPTTSSPSACWAGCARAGVDVPGDVVVTGWDDVMAARYAGLTTVRQPMRELGATAARLLDELITGTPHRTPPRAPAHRARDPHQQHHPPEGTLMNHAPLHEQAPPSPIALAATAAAWSSPPAAATTTPAPAARPERGDRRRQGHRHHRRLGDGHRGRDAPGLLRRRSRRPTPTPTVKVTAIPWEAAHDKIASAIASRRDARTSSLIGTTWMGEFAEAGGLSRPPRAWSTRPTSSPARGTPPRWAARRTASLVRRDPRPLLPHGPGREGRLVRGPADLGRAEAVRRAT